MEQIDEPESLSQFVLIADTQEDDNSAAQVSVPDQDNAAASSSGRNLCTTSETLLLLKVFIEEKARIRMSDSNHPKGKSIL
jgi:hypothetical protein